MQAVAEDLLNTNAGMLCVGNIQIVLDDHYTTMTNRLNKIAPCIHSTTCKVLSRLVSNRLKIVTSSMTLYICLAWGSIIHIHTYVPYRMVC